MTTKERMVLDTLAIDLLSVTIIAALLVLVVYDAGRALFALAN